MSPYKTKAGHTGAPKKPRTPAQNECICF